MSTIHYDQVQAALSQANSELDASELDGLICGSICNQLKSGHGRDLTRLLSSDAARSEASRALVQLTERLFAHNTDALYDAQKEFYLLLPDDDHSVEERTRALADWCRGFILGLLHVGSLDVNDLPADSAEVARDMMTISGAANDSADPRGDEWALAEVEEYVRAGAQLIFEELQKRVYADRPSGELH